MPSQSIARWRMVLALAGTVLSASAPSGTDIGAISILAEDDLITSNTVNTSAALLLNQPRTLAKSQTACQALSESLWSPTLQEFTAGLNNSLAYEVYAGRFSSKNLFWIAQNTTQVPPKSSRPQCQAISVNGTVENVSCYMALPALCTQSAPASNITYADTTTSFQVAQVVGSQTLVGYRDFLTFRFMGVRFAAEPERFTYSTPFNGTGTNYALNPAPECLQNGGGATDCLFANIYTTLLPAKANPIKSNLKPVMVYIYGGGFTTGSASNPTNDGGNLAARGDVVMVDLAYRLGTLGFLPFNDGVHNGNYWISDVISGLQWVKENIQHFGGDPSRITIFGESAGAETVQALLSTSKSAGLYHGAIMQSNYYQPYIPLAQAYKQSTLPILNETGCNTAADQFACLQAYNASGFLTLKTIANYPIVDGTYLTNTFINLNSSAKNNPTNSVPVMLGVNRDEEGVLGTIYPTSNLTQGIIDISTADGLNATALIASGLFPLGTGFNGNETLQVFNTTTRISTDASFTCTNEFVAYAAVKNRVWPHVWFYEFNRTYQDPGYNPNGLCNPPADAEHPFGNPSAEYLKCHAGDLANTFGNVARVGFPARDENDFPYQQLIVDYWTSFARNLNPNPDMEYLTVRGYWNTLNQIAVSGNWDAVDAARPRQMVLQWNGLMSGFKDRAQCSLVGEPLDLLLHATP